MNYEIPNTHPALIAYFLAASQGSLKFLENNFSTYSSFAKEATVRMFVIDSCIMELDCL